MERSDSPHPPEQGQSKHPGLSNAFNFNPYQKEARAMRKTSRKESMERLVKNEWGFHLVSG